MAVENPYTKGSAKAKAFDFLKSGKPQKTESLLKILGKTVTYPYQTLHILRHSKRLKKLGVQVVSDREEGTTKIVYKKATKKVAGKKAAKPASKTPVEA